MTKQLIDMTREEFKTYAESEWGYYYDDAQLDIAEANGFCCASCGKNPDEAGDHFNIDDKCRCEHCYIEEEMERCVLCEDLFGKPETPVGSHFYVNDELAEDSEIDSGIYRILSPEYDQYDIFGFTGFDQDAIRFIKRYRPRHDCNSGLICNECCTEINTSCKDNE